MIDAEIKERLDALDNEINRLFGLLGQDSARILAQRPAHLRNSGEDAYEVVGGHMMVKPSTARQ